MTLLCEAGTADCLVTKAFMKLVSNGWAIDLQQFGNLSMTDQRLLENLCN